MKRTPLTDLILLILGALGIWLIINALNIFPERVEPGLTSEQEEKLGALIVNGMTQGRTIQNPTVDSAMQQIAICLINELPEKNPDDYKIIIVNNDDINAFATLGNHLVFYKGLLEIADHPEEVAAVMSHELAHLELDHVSKKLKREISISVLLSALTGDQSLITDIARTLISSSWSREQEREADSYGQNLLIKANINPEYFASFFEKMYKSDSVSHFIPAFLSSHPATTARISSVRDLPTQGDFHPRRLNINWNQVKDALSSY